MLASQCPSVRVISSVLFSGGQRTGIALERAVYARTDPTLLDDVLAAVDNHITRHLFGECETYSVPLLFTDHVIEPRGLLGGRARVVVTHGIGCLSQMDKLILMRGGIILESETYPHATFNNQSEPCEFM
jgi:ATP-binding cassette subfamily C (CFTR/MRP) protein 1